MRGTVHCVLYIARCPRPTGSGTSRNAIWSHARGNRLHLPCHATPGIARLWWQGRSRAGPSGHSPLEGRAEPKTLDRLTKSGLPRLTKSPESLPALLVLVCSQNCIALQCTARAWPATVKGLQYMLYVSQPDDRHGRAKGPFDRDKPS